MEHNCSRCGWAMVPFDDDGNPARMRCPHCENMEDYDEPAKFGPRPFRERMEDEL